jgi:hypothetical protein
MGFRRASWSLKVNLRKRLQLQRASRAVRLALRVAKRARAIRRKMMRQGKLDRKVLAAERNAAARDMGRPLYIWRLPNDAEFI